MFEHPEPRSLPRRGPGRGTPGGECLRIDELLEAYADDELSTDERTLVDSHVAACAQCAAQLSLAQRVRGTLRELPAQAFPPALVPTDLAATEKIDEQPGRRVVSLGGWQRWRSARRTSRGSGRGRGGAPPVWAATAVAAALAAVLAAGLFLRPATPMPSHDVAQAEAEVKLALAYLGRIGERTGSIVAKDVLEERVAAPIARSVQSVLRPSTRTAEKSPR